jgi:rubrerythrin
MGDRWEENMVKKKAVKGVRATKKTVKKGDVYKCSVCGLAVTVDEVCGCVDACDIICCEKPMRAKKRA